MVLYSYGMVAKNQCSHRTFSIVRSRCSPDSHEWRLEESTLKSPFLIDLFVFIPHRKGTCMNVTDLWPCFLVPMGHNRSDMDCESLAYAPKLLGIPLPGSSLHSSAGRCPSGSQGGTHQHQSSDRIGPRDVRSEPHQECRSFAASIRNDSPI